MRKCLLLLVMAFAITYHAPVFAAVTTLTPAKGVYGMVTRPLQVQSGGGIAPIPLRISGDGTVTLTAVDIFGMPIAWQYTGTLQGGKTQTISFTPPASGYYQIVATQGGKQVATTDIGVIPPSYPGLRKDSFFASNTSGMRGGDELRFLQMIGIKVERCHFASGNLPIDLASLDQQLAETKAHDTWILPIVGYAFAGHLTDWANKLQMYGPPDDDAAFVSQWETVLRHFPEVTTYEFWNEPWIYGWTWADTPAAYRKLQTQWCVMARKVNPNLRVIAGNSWMFVEDHVEPYPECWKGHIDGTSHHPYQACGAATPRSGESFRSIDAGGEVTRRMGLPYYYLTEGGVQASLDTDNARNIVMYFVHAALAGAFQGNAQWDIGYGPQSTKVNTTLAVLTHFLEDRPIIADIWPSHELITGAIFANPKFVTPEVKALPRARDLSARWDVPVPADRANDTTKVAVIWSMTGTGDVEQLDQQGLLTIADARGLTAYDMVGRVIPSQRGKLVLPFTKNPVYITTDTLSVIQLKDRINGGQISQVTPVNMYAESLSLPADQSQQLHVRMENQLNVDVSGTLTVRLPGTQAASSAQFSIAAGKLVEVSVPWPGVAVNDTNRYGILLSAQLKKTNSLAAFPPVQVSQAISVARFVKRMITVDGALDDWRGVTPVTILPPGHAKIDLTEYLLNPNKPLPQASATGQTNGGVKVYSAYDERNVYIAVDGWNAKSSAGALWHEGLPYRTGMQDGLNYPSLCGDYIQLAFGFRDRVPGYGRQMDDPYAWKGHFYDTDYLYTALASTGGDILVREWGPHTTRGTAYQTADRQPGVGAIPGAQIFIHGTVYEIAIPRSELALFDPATQSRFRFSVSLNCDAMSWSETAGVFDYWVSAGSFGPSWIGHYPNQTFFGIER